MKIRVVQIWGFLMTVLGWIFVACTMAMEGWKISTIGGMGGSAIMKVLWYWSSLWRSCYTDSAAMTSCHDFPVLWSVEGYVQIVRGLLMAALSVGILGFILSLMGMECTYLGGKDKSKYRKIYTGGCCHILSGALSTSGYAVYAEYVSVENFNADITGLTYDLGTPLFLGWVGSLFHMAGGFFYLWSVCKLLCEGKKTVISIEAQPDPEQNKSTTDPPDLSENLPKSKMSSVSELSSKPERSKVSVAFKSGRKARSARSSRTGRTTLSARSSGSSYDSRSGLSSMSTLYTLSESRSSSSSRSSRSVSSLSASTVSETTPFVKNTYV